MAATSPPTPRNRRTTAAPTHGERRRGEILRTAVDIASAEGLDGLSIGRLAEEVSMTKSGVFAHFGSKEELQLETVATAAVQFQDRVLGAATESEPGVERVRALMAAWVRYVEETEYRGGCFFFATSAEFSGRTGAVREKLATLTRHWLATLEREIRTAQRLREIAADIDPAGMAFRLHAFVQEANWMRETLDDDDAFAKARRAIDETLSGSLAPKRTL